MMKIVEIVKKNKTIWLLGIFMGIFFSGVNALGRYLNGAASEGLPGILRTFFLWFPVAFGVSSLLLAGIRRGTDWISGTWLNKISVEILNGKKSFWIGWGVIFLLWLPALLASWPGVYVIDNVFQFQWFQEGNISAHHPILHTYLLGFCMEAGKKIFGSYEAGLGVYSVGQMLILSGLFSYTIYALRDKLAGIFRLVCLLLYGCMPYHAVSSFTATKDILFSGFFLILVLKSYELAMDTEVFFSSKKKISQYIVIVFLSCCFRNTGIYVFLCMIPFLLFLGRRYWKRALLLAMIPVLLWGVYTGPVYQALHIEKGSSGEILSVPMQQISRALLEEGDKLDAKVTEEAEIYIPGYESYAPRVADPVKDTFNNQAFEEDPVGFVSLWAKIGLSCPSSYMKAFLEMNLGFWWPAMDFPDPGTYLAFIPYRNADMEQVGEIPGKVVYIERQSFLPALEGFYQDYTEEGKFEQIPVLSWLYSPGVYFWIICFGIIYCFYTKRFRTILPWAVLLLLWLTLMVSPVVVFRYAYPLVVSLPIMLAMITGKYRRTEKKNEKTV